MNNKGESDRLMLAIRLIMKKNRVRHADLANSLGLSVPTVKRTLTRGPLSIERLMQICDALDVSFYELVETAKENAGEALSWMSDDQEKFLLDHPDATEYLIYLMNGITSDEIRKQTGLTAIQSKKYLARLETRGLVVKSSIPGTLKVAPSVLRGARPGGKLALDFARRCSEVAPQIVREGLLNLPQASSTRRQNKMATAIGFQLSEKSRKEIQVQFKEVLSQYAAIERLEGRSLPSSRLNPISVVVCVDEINLYAEAYRGSLK